MKVEMVAIIFIAVFLALDTEAVHAIKRPTEQIKKKSFTSLKYCSSEVFAEPSRLPGHTHAQLHGASSFNALPPCS